MKRVAQLLVLSLILLAAPAFAIDNISGTYTFHFNGALPRIGILTFDGVGNVQGIVIWQFTIEYPFYQSVDGTYSSLGSFGIIDLRQGDIGGPSIAQRGNSAKVPVKFSIAYIPTAADSQLELFSGHGLANMAGLATKQ
jgi:hypothetical protein